MFQFPGNANSQSFQEGSSQVIDKEGCCDIKHPSTTKNGCNGNETESGFDESSQEWNEEIGPLTDDNVVATGETDAQNKFSKADDVEKTNSANNEKNNEINKTSRPKRLQHHLSWQNALKKAQCLPDPWEKFHIDDSCPKECAIRHRYNALKKTWVKDEVTIKMEALVS